jgi:hypothetical protein
VPPFQFRATVWAGGQAVDRPASPIVGYVMLMEFSQVAATWRIFLATLPRVLMAEKMRFFTIFAVSRLTSPHFFPLELCFHAIISTANGSSRRSGHSRDAQAC